MFPVPESNWMGDFAISVAIGHQIGAARGDRSIFSAMDISQDELFAILGRSINDLILRHRKDLERKRQVTSEESERKGRWVDGTPEYSFHICGLRKLFPKALFIHLVRDVRSVVRSMLNFHLVAGHDLVNNEEEAYNYWFRTVSSCLLAERAYGPRVVLRLRYSDLLNAPEIAMRSVLEFIGEPGPTPHSSSGQRGFAPKLKKLRSRLKFRRPHPMKSRLPSTSASNMLRA